MLGELRDSLSFYHERKDYDLFRQFFVYLKNHARDGHPKLPYFSYEQFAKAYSEFRSYMEQNQIDSQAEFQTADSLLQFLYELNVIFYKTQGAKAQIWKTSFASRTRGDIRPRVAIGGEYRMHRGLARAIYPEFL